MNLIINIGIIIASILLVAMILYIVLALLKSEYNSRRGHICENCGWRTGSGKCLKKAEFRNNKETCVWWEGKEW